MKAEESKLTQVFSDSKTYEIPRYQRPYSWTEKHSQDMINDIFDAFENNQNEYFIGTIISIEKERDKLFEVVDGQQRLTTLNLIFSKLRDLLEDAAAKNVMQSRILPINVLTGETEKPRLLIRPQDQRFFLNHILKGLKDMDLTDLSETQIRMINNLTEIENYLKDKDQSKLKLFANYLLENVYVVFVKTESFSSAYRLFNVLNARGMSLSNGDLLKNKLFDMSQNDNSTQNTLEEYWNELEEIVSLKNLDFFLSHHRTSLLGNKAQDDLFREYENYLSKKSISPLAFAQSLVKSAKNYIKIKNNDFEDVKIKRIIKSLLNVSYDEWIPPFLCYLNNSNRQMSLLEFIDYLDKITMQNWIRRLGRTKRNTVYYNLISDIQNNKTRNAMIETVKKSSNNNELEASLNGNIYGMSYDSAILLRLEMEQQDESVTKDFGGLISIEHVLPQSLKDPYWSSRFSTEEHSDWVHKLGNITLLSGRKNFAAQFYSFDKKKEIYLIRDAKTSFDMTKEICIQQEWTLKSIQTRQVKLVDLAKKIWFI